MSRQKGKVLQRSVCHLHLLLRYKFSYPTVSPVHFTAWEPPEGASKSFTPIVSEDSEPKPDSAVALMPVVTPVPKPALLIRPWLPSRPSVPGFACAVVPRGPFRSPPPPLPTVASRSFPMTVRPPPRAIKQEDVELPANFKPPSPESVIKHPLANKWTLWWFCPGKS